MDKSAKKFPITFGSQRLPCHFGGSLFATLLLWLYPMVFVFGTVPSRTNSDSDWYPEASSCALSLVLTTWLISDARQRRLKLCYDYDFFFYLAWPILLPVYLFQTRGTRAFLTLFCFAGIWMFSLLVALGITLLRHS